MKKTSLTRVINSLAGLILAVAAGSIFAEQLSTPPQADRETARLVARLVPQYHLHHPKIDDAASERIFHGFLKMLDQGKMYFLNSDIDSFSPHKTTLDDEIKEGNLDFAYRVFEVYKERLSQQLALAHQLIDQEHDFSLDETMTTDSKALDWAPTQQELDDRWRKRVKFDLLQYKLDDEPMDKAREKLHKRYRNIKRSIDQTGPSDRLELFLTAATSAFDPHSTYMSPQSWEDFEIQLKLSLDGIGAALRADDGYTVVASIVPGGAAATDGRLKVGDKITGVGQQDGDIEDIFDMKLTDVVRKIRGPRGTRLRLQVKSEAGGETQVFELTRQKIELNESAVKAEIIEASTRVGRPGRIGVVSIPSFYRDFEQAQDGSANFKSAAADLRRVLTQQFANETLDGLIIDLRNNGGGALSEAIEITGQFIDQGPVVQVKETGSPQKALNDEEPGLLFKGPIVVVCNRLSASASEIFAGAIKDYRRGIIVGDSTTHGKGTVQNLMDVAPREPLRIFNRQDRGKLKLTIQQFYRVNGDSTQNRGVTSDIVLPSRLDHLDEGESGLDNALPFEKIDAARFSPNRLVSSDLVAALQKSSERRVTANEDFQKLEDVIRRDLERKNRKTISLNESVRRQERAAEKQAAKENPEEDSEDPTPKDPNAPIFPQDFYNDELLNIALDYIEAFPSLAGGGRTTAGG
ncbi:MAG: carboxy terminal-processing peptidase [Planctomyces sp.]|nr:carboxy terminal-processing peptidase [Planctomyces sp.]